mgnify:CR=1 FL=1
MGGTPPTNYIRHLHNQLHSYWVLGAEVPSFNIQALTYETCLVYLGYQIVITPKVLVYLSFEIANALILPLCTLHYWLNETHDKAH